MRYVCGRLVDYRGLLGEGCLLYSEDSGRIEGFAKAPPSNGEGRDYRGRGYLVAPGLIDMHVHLRGLELSYKEDEETGGWAAAAAGITLVVDMPNTRPEIRSPDLVMEKLRALEKAPVDYGLYAGVPDEPRDVLEMSRLPIAGFKVYPADLAIRRPAVEAVTRTRRLVVLHPEDPQASRADAASGDPRGRESHRGCWLEVLAVLDAAALHAGGPARLHVTHASCPQTVATARRLGFTVDATPHHLFWTYHDADDPCLYKVNPPLRSPREQARLLSLLLEGRIDAVASDHAPHAPREKQGDPLACSPGFPWLEAWPWLLFRLVRVGALKLREFLWLASRGPAVILGLRDYGALEVGARANILVFDPSVEWRFAGPRHSRAGLTPALMERLAGEPVEVIVGGRTVYLEGEPQGAGNRVNPFARGDAGGG
jgi:dihydroorotase